MPKTRTCDLSKLELFQWSPYSHFYVDALGPLCSYSIPYQYALVLLDHTSRWMHAIPLHSLTAKNCCEALLSCWQFTGLPTKLTMNNASNFTTDITREFLRWLGVSSIWCTPRHPEAKVSSAQLAHSSHLLLRLPMITQSHGIIFYQ